MNSSVHSGNSGLVADPFRIIRELLNRIEDTKTGKIIEELCGNIPGKIYMDAEKLVNMLENKVYNGLDIVEGMNYTTPDYLQAFMNWNFKPQLTCTGVDNIPSISNAGNVLRGDLKMRYSLRLPPWMCVEKAREV